MFKNPEERRQLEVLKNMIIKGEIKVKKLASILKEELKVFKEKLRVYGLNEDENSGLNVKEAQLVLYEYGYRVFEKEEELSPRQPVVSIMGHVDHGKTTLLDKMRNSELAQSEAGGITQRIGAFSVKKDGQIITFIDTPGHEAFNNMRERGGMCTDIIVLVVSATDGVQQQTLEVIDIAQKNGNTLIVAINKIDVLGCRPLEEVEHELYHKAKVNLETFGGNVPCIHISAKFNRNIDLLLELILFESELRNLRGNFNALAEGRVVESRNITHKNVNEGLDQGKGCTLIIQRGQLKIDDWIIIGTEPFKIKKMWDDRANDLSKAILSQAVEIIGLKELPESGEQFFGVHNEIEAKLVSKRLQQIKKEQIQSNKDDYSDMKNSRIKFKSGREKRMFFSGNKSFQKEKYQELEDNYLSQINSLQQKILQRQDLIDSEKDKNQLEMLQEKQDKDIQKLNEVEEKLNVHYKNMDNFIKDSLKDKSEKEEESQSGIKIYVKSADKGTLETIREQMTKIAKNNEGIELQLVGNDVGEITQQDVRQAILYDAIIMGMNVGITTEGCKIAKDNKIMIKTSKIIYQLLESVQNVIDDYQNKEKLIMENKGQGRVKMVYNVKTKVGYQNVAGCAVTKGKMSRKYRVRVVRDGEEVAKDCTVQQLKHFKDDVQEVLKGNECGLALNEFHEFIVNDLIEFYETKPYIKTFVPDSLD